MDAKTIIAIVLVAALAVLAGCQSNASVSSTEIIAPAPVAAIPASPVPAPAPAPAPAAEPEAVSAPEAAVVSNVVSSYEYAGYTMSIEAYDGYALITLPAAATAADVDAFMANEVALYGSMLDGVTYSYKYSARAVLDEYKNYDIPFGFFLPNDGYGAGYGQNGFNMTGGVNADGTYINPVYSGATHYGSYPFVNNGTANGGLGSSYWTGSDSDGVNRIADASYVKIKNITLGYTFPQKWMNKIRVKSLRLYCTVTNPFVFTDYKGFDPEWADADLDQDGPSTVTWQFGGSIKF